jgi:hypothetical protein
MESRRLVTCSLSLSFGLWTRNTREVFTSVISAHRHVKGRAYSGFYAYPHLPLEAEDCAVYFLAGRGAVLCAGPSSHTSPSFHSSIPLSTRFYLRPGPGGDRGCCFLAAGEVARSGLWAYFRSFDLYAFGTPVTSAVLYLIWLLVW